MNKEDFERLSRRTRIASIVNSSLVQSRKSVAEGVDEAGSVLELEIEQETDFLSKEVTWIEFLKELEDCKLSEFYKLHQSKLSPAITPEAQRELSVDMPNPTKVSPVSKTTPSYFKRFLFA